MDNYTNATEADLTADLAALDEQMGAIRDLKRPIVAELRRREEERRLAALAARFTSDELAAMQTIQARGIESTVRFGEMGGKG